MSAPQALTDAAGPSRPARRPRASPGQPDASSSSRWRWFKQALVIFVVAVSVTALLSSPWWATRVLSQLEFFHVRVVTFDGVRYGTAAGYLQAMRVDTTQSVWQSLASLDTRLGALPLVQSVAVERRLPGTIAVHIRERQPVAFVQVNGMLRVADVTGRVLPIDPTHSPLDLPVAMSADTSVLQVINALRTETPALYARVSSASRVDRGEIRFVLGPVVVRATPDVTPRRFSDILPVEADLARNGLRAVELDLRFRDQVIARQP